MRFQENRKLALIVLIVAALLCTFISGGAGLAKERRQASEAFFSVSESIWADLNELGDNAKVLASIARQYASIDEALCLDVDSAVEVLRDLQGQQDVAAMFDASQTLTDCVEELYTVGNAVDMRENEQKDFRSVYKNFSSANLRISHDPYNETAAEFNMKLSRFPASLIGLVCGVDQLDLFM